jgi:hypothetical protein
VPSAGAGLSGAALDSAEALAAFRDNIDAIHKRDRARYLASYVQTDRLARNGVSGLERGWEGWSARRDSTFPDTLVARELRVVPVSPGVVYGTYRYQVTQAGSTTAGISERGARAHPRRVAHRREHRLPGGRPRGGPAVTARAT